MKQKWILTAAAMLLAVLAAGCHEAGSDVPTTDTEGTSAQIETTAAATHTTGQTGPNGETTAATAAGGEEETTATTDPVHIQEGVTDWENPTAGKEEPGTTETQPQAPTTDTTAPEQTDTPQPSQSTEPAEEEPTGPELLTYEQYDALSPKEKQAYFESFATVEEFYEWLEAAEEAYEDKQGGTSGDPIIVIPGGENPD